jgi:hypothetical protein
MNNEITLEELNKIRNTPMLFILGKSRSGTTLLQSILNSHPDIIGSPESKFIMVLYPRFAHIREWSEKNVYDFIRELYNFPFFSKRWNVDKALLTNYLLTEKNHLNYAIACKVVYYLRGQNKQNVHYLSDKNPDYFLFLKQLFKLFPEAKFIHLVREPKDNVLSTIRAFEGTNSFRIATKWLAVNTIIERIKIKMPDKSITVKYENMVKNPEMILKSICAFLEIPFTPEMLDRNMTEAVKRNSAIVELPKNRQANLFKPISSSSVGKWKTDMKPFDIAAVEFIAGKYAAEQYGYQINPLQNKDIRVPYFKVLKETCIYYVWQIFTRIRYKSYRINKLYSRIKQKTWGDKILPSQYF